jgi:hypothetical protein
LPWRPPQTWFTSACMPAMIGAANEVPPPRLQLIGAPTQGAPKLVGSEKQVTNAWFHGPSAENIEMSGKSRTPSDGFPKTLCQPGFFQPRHVPFDIGGLEWAHGEPLVAASPSIRIPTAQHLDRKLSTGNRTNLHESVSIPLLCRHRHGPWSFTARHATNVTTPASSGGTKVSLLSNG